MPLPDAPDYSKRIYELLKETDLENLTYSQFQGVAEKLFIEPENEDEMRRECFNSNLKLNTVLTT